MENFETTMAQRIARAASALEKRRTGRLPKRVTVAINKNTLAITLHGVLSTTEKELARTPAGAVLIQEHLRQLFNCSNLLRRAIQRITGAAVRAGTEEHVTTSGVAIKSFVTGTVVQFYLLDRTCRAAIWSGRGPSLMR